MELYVTESDINYHDAVLQPSRFIHLNMLAEIWLVDTQHSQIKKILETALKVAQAFNNNEDIEQIENLLTGLK